MLYAIYIVVILGLRSVRTGESDTTTPQNTRTEVMIGVDGTPQLGKDEVGSAKATKI